MKFPLSPSSSCARVFLLAGLLVFLFVTEPVFAYDLHSDPARGERAENRQSGKNAAAAQAQSQYGGKVLSVSEEGGEGRKVYKVKLLLDSGRIKIVTVYGN